MKKKRAIAMAKKKHTNSIMKLGRNSVLAFGKKLKSRNDQVSSVYGSNTMFVENKPDCSSLYNSLNNTTINPNSKIIRNLKRSMKNYKPPKSKQGSIEKKSKASIDGNLKQKQFRGQRIVDKRHSLASGPFLNSFSNFRLSTPHNDKNITSFIGENSFNNRLKSKNQLLLKSFHSTTPQHMYEINTGKTTLLQNCWLIFKSTISFIVDLKGANNSQNQINFTNF